MQHGQLFSYGGGSGSGGCHPHIPTVQEVEAGLALVSSQASGSHYSLPQVYSQALAAGVRCSPLASETAELPVGVRTASTP